MKNIKKFIGISVILFLGMLISYGQLAKPAFAQEIGKVGVVDVLKVYNEWEVQKKADAEFQPKRDKLQARDQEISDLKKELQRQKSVLKPEQVTQKETDIKTAERDLRDQVESLSEEIDKKAKELTKELDGKLQKIYNDLSGKEGYTLILEKRAVRYNKPEMDLTKRITELLNKMETTTTPAESEKTAPAPTGVLKKSK